jgi:branched-chain amino acid transport system permease protein
MARLSVNDTMQRWWSHQPMWLKLVLCAVLLGIVCVIPPQLSPRWQSTLFFPIGLYILLALGLNIVVGQAGMLDLGYVAFFAVGAYAAATLTTEGGLESWAALVPAIAAAMVAGVILGAPTLRLRGDYLAIVTLGFGEIVRIIAENTNALGESRGITDIPHPSGIFGVEFVNAPLPYVYLALAAIVIAIAMKVRLNGSRVGRAWVAIREDEDAAELMGVPTFKMKLWAFAMGASTGGLAGWIYASRVQFISPALFPFFLSVVILAAVVLGGMGSIPGVLAGGFLIAFIPEYLREAAAGEWLTERLNTITGGSATDINEYRFLLFGAALVAVMIFRPQGLIPSRRRAAELAEAPVGAGLAATVPDAVDDSAEIADDEPQSTARAAEQFETEAVRTEEVVLELVDVTMTFGGVQALRQVSSAVRRGEIFGIIGPNGAGKTTLFNCITGAYKATAGSIKVFGRDTAGMPPYRITRELGVARTFQNIRLFPNMTSEENVKVGADAHHRVSVPGTLLLLPAGFREEHEGEETARRLLDFVGIAHRADDLARNLPYGDQRRLEIARAMATGAKLLLLDEPAAGMNPSEKRALVALIQTVRASGVTVVLIEHDMGLVMDVCDRIAVLDFGEKIAEDDPAAIQQNERVINAYLGVPSDAA